MSSHYTLEEVRRNIDVLLRDDAAMTVLTLFAQTQAVKTRYGYYAYTDLIAEAMTRAIQPDGRKWKVEDSAVSFFSGAIKSIAYQWKEPGNKIKGLKFQKVYATEADIERLENEAHLSTPESELAAKQEANEIMSLFDNDPIGQQILIAMIKGIEGVELRNETGLSETDYDTKRRYVRRRVMFWKSVQ